MRLLWTSILRNLDALATGYMRFSLSISGFCTANKAKFLNLNWPTHGSQMIRWFSSLRCVKLEVEGVIGSCWFTNSAHACQNGDFHLSAVILYTAGQSHLLRGENDKTIRLYSS